VTGYKLLGRAAWLLPALGAVALVRALAAPVAQVSIAPPQAASAAVATRTGAAPQPDSLAAGVRALAPFRWQRRPADVPYGTQAPVVTGPPAPPKPRLRLVGIVSGLAPLALIEGLPGTTRAVVLGAGDTMAGFTVTAIRGAEVEVAGADTLWILSVEEPWNSSR